MKAKHFLLAFFLLCFSLTLGACGEQGVHAFTQDGIRYVTDQYQPFKWSVTEIPEDCVVLDGILSEVRGVPVTEIMLGKGLPFLQLTEVRLPDSITSIIGSGFSGCENLETVSVGKGLKMLAGHGFSGCSSLKDLTLPVSLQTIEQGVFNGCTALTDIYYEDSTADWENVSKANG